MIRRELIPVLSALAFQGRADDGPRIEHIDGFTSRMNAFIESLNRGVIDLNLWRRARAAWHKVEGKD